MVPHVCLPLADVGFYLGGEPMGLFRIIDRWRIRRKFEKYVSPGVIKLLEEAPEKFISTLPEMKHFQFFVVSIDEANPYDISPFTADIADQIFHHGGASIP